MGRESQQRQFWLSSSTLQKQEWNSKHSQHENIVLLIWLIYYLWATFSDPKTCNWSPSWRVDLWSQGINPGTSVPGSRSFSTLYLWHLSGVIVYYCSTTIISTTVLLYVRLVPCRICTRWFVLNLVHPTWGWNYLVELLLIYVYTSHRLLQCLHIYYHYLNQGSTTII
jgi:hypothetical protein